MAATAAAARRLWLQRSEPSVLSRRILPLRSEPSALSRRVIPRRVLSRFQIRNFTNAAPEPPPEDKSLKQAMEFVKNLKEVFTTGAVHEELNATKKLSSTVEHMDERMNKYVNFFWMSALIVVPAPLVINTWLYFQQSELKSISGKQEKLETAMTAMDNRVFALEYASSFNEKQQMLTKAKEAQPPPSSAKVSDA